MVTVRPEATVSMAVTEASAARMSSRRSGRNAAQRSITYATADITKRSPHCRRCPLRSVTADGIISTRSQICTSETELPRLTVQNEPLSFRRITPNTTDCFKRSNPAALITQITATILCPTADCAAIAAICIFALAASPLGADAAAK